jgi:hexosaminidase
VKNTSVIPRPLSWSVGEGRFLLRADTPVVHHGVSAEAASAAASFCETLLRMGGPALRPTPANTDGSRGKGAIRFAISSDGPADGEGYTLDASADGVEVQARTEAGLFYGAQTLAQLLTPEASLPATHIEDAPRFRWRGVLLDPARHFYTKDEVLRVIDLMALHKLNVLHLHLTDDTGWRLELTRFPRLTEVSAWRSKPGFATDPRDVTAWSPDGRYGGFYTQEDIRGIVDCAAKRHITVVPEIEMPGHALSALVACPEYSCTGGPFVMQEESAIQENVYCAGNDGTFAFLEEVLDEVVGLFPGPWVHIGGDECPKTRWKSCPKCQERMKQENLGNEDELQSWFIRRIERFLNSRGRRMIGWDEILEGGLAPNAAVMSWRGVSGGIEAAKAGHDVVMSPWSHVYLDYRQAQNGEPKAMGDRVTTTETVYSYEPVPDELTPSEATRVLGTQAQLWGEFIPNARHLDYMLWPRACALAEVAWSPKEAKDWPDFQARLKEHLARLDALGVNYRRDPPQPCTWLHRGKETDS